MKVALLTGLSALALLASSWSAAKAEPLVFHYTYPEAHPLPMMFPVDENNNKVGGPCKFGSGVITLLEEVKPGVYIIHYTATERRDGFCADGRGRTILRYITHIQMFSKRSAAVGD